jgi:hypothetical protein
MTDVDVVTGERRAAALQRAPKRPGVWSRPVLRGLAAGLVVAVGAAWAGLQVQPKPLPNAALQPGQDMQSVPLPAALPAPVDRFYRALYGDQVPLVDTAVISGRGTMRISGITLPARFRFSHVAGEHYRHYIETTFFGMRLLRVNEWYTDGTARMQLPFGEFAGPRVDQGANLALWAENIYMPAVWVTDPRVRWEAVDDTTALLVVPFGEGSETFTVTFDADSGLLQRMESMRFKGESSQAKTLWINEVHEWGEIDGQPIPLLATVTWEDEGSPWAKLRTEDVLYNADLSDYIRNSGA